MTKELESLPPLPAPVKLALFMGEAMQGSEIRLLSGSYEPGCAQYSYDQVREYGQLCRKQALEDAKKAVLDWLNPASEDLRHIDIVLEELK